MTIVTSLEAALIVSVAFVLGGLVKGLVGFGLPLVTLPLLSAITSIPEAIALNFLPVVFSNVAQIVETRRARAVLLRIWPLVAATVVLLFFGTVFLTALDKRSVQFAIGVMIIGHLLLERRGWSLAIQRRREPWYLAGAGVLAAMLGSVSSFCMFPSVQLLHSMRLTRAEFVFSVCVFLLAVYLTLWFGLMRNGVSMMALLPDSLFCTAPLLLGTWLGGVMRNRVSETLFKRWVAAGLAATGLVLVLRPLGDWLVGG